MVCNQVTVNSAACLKNSWCNSWRIYVVNAVLLKLLPELYQFRYSQSAINDNQDTNSSASNEHSSFAINTVTRFSVNLLVIAEKPDLVIIDRIEEKMDIFELTVPLETNIKNANTQKMNKYEHFITDITTRDVSVHPFEIGSRRFISP